MRKQPEEVQGGEVSGGGLGSPLPEGAKLGRDSAEDVVPAVEPAEKEADEQEG